MSGLLIGGYWCYECHRAVNPAMDVELKCPCCDGGFIEEMGSRGDMDSVPALVSDPVPSPWEHIFPSMMGGSSRHSRSLMEEGEEDEEDDDEEESQLNHEFQEILRMRRRSSVILRLLRSLRDDFRLQSENFQRERNREIVRQSIRENMFLIDPFSQASVSHGTSDNDESQNQDSVNIAGGASFGDFLVGPGLDLLLQHLAEMDSSRQGTPPAKKEAVDALPTVKIQEVTCCSVCLDDFVIDAEAKEMPCKHKFHGDCILPWLELHSSCPLCRYQLPADESKISSRSNNGNRVESVSGTTTESEQIPFLWPFGETFLLSGSENGRNSSLNPSSTQSNYGTSHSHSEDN